MTLKLSPDNAPEGIRLQGGHPIVSDCQPHALIIAYWLVICALAVFLRPAMPVDETRYLSVAWEMFHTGDWLVPSRNFQPYDHKPPLLFWLINAVWSVTGFSVLVARCLTLLEALLVVALIMRLARRLVPDAPGLPAVAGLAYSGSVLVTTYGSLVMFDQLLTAGVLVAVTALWDAATKGRWRWPELVALSIGLGLAMLAKGPVALVSVMAVGLTWPFWRPQAVTPISGRHWYGWLIAGVLAGAVILGAWAIPAALTGGEAFAEKLLWEQTAGRMHNSFAHKEPFWWYLAAAPVLLAPWIFWTDLWRAAGEHFSGWSKEASAISPAHKLVMIWFGAGLLLFSLISGKKPHYLIQLMPALAIWIALVAQQLDARQEQLATQRHGWLRAVLALLPVLIALAACAVIALTSELLPPKIVAVTAKLSHPAAAIGIAACVAFAIPAFMLLSHPYRRKRAAGLPPGSRMVMLFSLESLILFAIVHLVGSGFVRTEFSPEPMAQYLAAHLGDRPLANVGRYDGELGAFVPLTRPVDEITREQIGLWLEHHPDGMVLLRDRHPDEDLPAVIEYATRYRNRDWFVLSSP